MKYLTLTLAVLALAVAAPAVACPHTGFGAIACQNCGGSVQAFGGSFGAAYADPGFAAPAPPVVQTRTRTTTTYSTQFAAPAPPMQAYQSFGGSYGAQSFGAGSCATGACGNGFGGFGDTAPASGHRRGFSLQFGFGRRW